MPISSINGEPIVVDTVDLRQVGIIEMKKGYIAVGTSAAINPNTEPVLSSNNYRYAYVDCSLGDIFEVELMGGSTARSFAMIAGSSYSTPYAVLSRMRTEFNNRRMRTYIVINNASVEYLLVQSNFTGLPTSHIRKLTHDEYLTVRREVDYRWLVECAQVKGVTLGPSGDSKTHAQGTVSPFVPVRRGDVIEGKVSCFEDSVIVSYYDRDFGFKYGIAQGAGNTTPTDFSFGVPEHGWVRFSMYRNFEYDSEPDGWAYNMMRNFHVSITPHGGHVDEELLSNSYTELEYLRAARMYKDGEAPNFTVLHFTDLHGDEMTLRTIAACLDQEAIFGKHIDAAICTGDLVLSNVEDDSTFLTKFCNLYRPIMLTLGNHDVRPKNTATWHYTDSITIQATYQRFLADKIGEWEVTTPNILYPTYYYKDYDTQGIRLIALDPQMGAHSTSTERDAQLAWLEDVLADASEKELGVIVAQHFPIQGTPNLIPCNFTDVNSVSYTQIGNSNYNQATVEGFQERVQDFIDGGGDFICWLSGHNHADFVYTVEQYPQQLCIICGTASTLQDSRMADRSTGKAKNLFNAVTVTREENHVRVVRFGATTTRYMVSKIALCINYKTMEVVAQA